MYIDRSARSEVQGGMAGRSTMSDIVSEPDTDEIGLHFVAPVYNDQRTLIGLVDVRTSLEPLHELVALDQNRSGEGSYSVLLDPNGIRLSIPSHPELLFLPAIPWWPACIP
ncbi:MAG: hypothetical protein AB4911_21975 [Oscillochloridaceae bacterium umkhey_bin13]